MLFTCDSGVYVPIIRKLFNISIYQWFVLTTTTSTAAIATNVPAHYKPHRYNYPWQLGSPCYEAFEGQHGAYRFGGWRPGPWSRCPMLWMLSGWKVVDNKRLVGGFNPSENHRSINQPSQIFIGENKKYIHMSKAPTRSWSIKALLTFWVSQLGSVVWWGPTGKSRNGEGALATGHPMPRSSRAIPLNKSSERTEHPHFWWFQWYLMMIPMIFKMPALFSVYHPLQSSKRHQTLANHGIPRIRLG